jgi:hypothetical protein
MRSNMHTPYPAINRAPDLWESTSKTAVLQALQGALIDAEKTRKVDAQTLHSFLDGEHRQALEARLAILYPKTSAEVWNIQEAGHRYFPLIPMYADRLSTQMAIKPPETWLEDPDTGERLPEDDPRSIQWRADQTAMQWHQTLATIERWINSGMNQALTHVCMRKGSIRWEPTTSYQVSVNQDHDEPSRLEGARHITIALPQRSDSAEAYNEETLYLTYERIESKDDRGRITGTEWHMWLHDAAGGLRQSPTFDDSVNQYGLHPVTVWRHVDPAPGCFWVPANKGWIHQQLSADIKLCDLDHLRHQVHSVAVAKGMGGAKLPPTGPDAVIESTEPDFSFSYETPDPRLELLIEGFNFDLRASAVAESLPADTWEANSSTRNLGAKQLEQHALMMRRRRVLPYYGDALSQTFAAHKAVGDHWAARLNRTTFGDVTLGYEFAPIPMVQDEGRHILVVEKGIALGLTSSIREVMDTRGLTRSESIAFIEQNREDTAASMTIAGTLPDGELTAPLSDTPETPPSSQDDG